jgi:toxin ParE1/3/4
LLIDQPEIGRPGRIGGTRQLVISRSFIVIYRVHQNIEQVEILRLVHGAQKWPPKS